MKVVVDGATGFVGSRLIRELLRGRHEVVAIARPNATTSAHARVFGAISGSVADKVGVHQLRVVEHASLADGGARERSRRWRELLDGAASYWHLAACLKFRTADRDELFRTNVTETRRCSEMVRTTPDVTFVHVSTAYVCGRSHMCDAPETFLPPADPAVYRNSYEESKRAAEAVIEEHLESGCPAVVLRPSQIVGDSVTGSAGTHYGVYDLIRRAWALSRRYPGETLRIIGEPTTRQNLVPIDRLVRWMSTIDLARAAKLKCPVVNMVAQGGPSNASLADVLCRHVPLRYEFTTSEEFDLATASLPEKLLAASMAFTGSYLRDDVTFARGNLRALLDEKDEVVVDQPMFERLLVGFLREMRVA